MYYEIHDRIIAAHYEELKDLPAPLRQSKILKYYMEEVPLHFRPGDPIAGWYGYESEPEAAPSVPAFDYIHVMTPEEQLIRRDLEKGHLIEINFNRSHTCIDYGTILNQGLSHYIDKVKAALAETPEDIYLQAMLQALNTVIAFAHRFADLAKQQSLRESCPAEKNRLMRICNMLMRVPEHPAQDLYEAVQSLYIVHFAIPMAEQAWYSISVGRADQYLYPFYQRSLANGATEDELKALFKHLFLLFDTYSGWDNTLNIGGMDADGNDMMNDLSKLLIQAEKESALRSPIFAVRVNPNTPEEILDSVIDFDLFKIGQPTFYGELPCRQAVQRRGVSKAESCHFSANSCMGLVIAGKEFADMWGIKFNTHLPLELAINGGKPFHGELAFPLKTPPRQIDSFESLLEQYNAYMDEVLTECARYYRMVALEQELNGPDPYVSALIEGCIAARRDRSVAAVYNTVTVETMGLMNTCDALEALRSLVFEQKKYSLSQIIDEAKNNYEDAPALMYELRKCKKYGSNDDNSNAIVRAVTQMYAQVCQRESQGNMPFLPSLHTIDANVSFGQGLYATLDGRQAGIPVNKNANPSALLDRQDHTSHILSAASFDQASFCGGQPIDLYFEKSWFETKQMRDKIKTLIKTYFELGGLQVQVNSVDIALLEKAHIAPEDYPHVIVRKGGHSVRFSQMDPAVREDMIRQAKSFESA